MIALFSGKESYNKFEIAIIALICSKENIADCMTNSSPMHRLHDVMRSNTGNVVATQWIDREK